MRPRYFDGWHYCTKSMWLPVVPGIYPSPFNKTFHLEMGLVVGGEKGEDWQGEEQDISVLPQEMLVDYVRISQVRGYSTHSKKIRNTDARRFQLS